MPHVTRKKNGHLIIATSDNGTVQMEWDWAQLEADVKAAIAVYEDKQVHKDTAKKETAKKPAAKKETAKKPAAKKETAKKPAAKKTPVKKK